MLSDQRLLAAGDVRVLQQARMQLQDAGEVRRDVLRAEIANSWQRSLSAGVDLQATLSPDFCLQTQADLKQLLSLNQQLILAATPEMEHLACQFKNCGGLVMLADNQATILSSKGDPRCLAGDVGRALNPGVSWCETLRGTNGLGTTLIDDAVTLVNGAEHFNEQATVFSCFAAPLHHPNGHVIGVLDISFLGHQPQPGPGLAAVQMAALAIERRLFISLYADCAVLAFHSKLEYLHSCWQGLIALDEDGFVTAVNLHASQLLQRSSQILLGIEVQTLLGLSFGQLRQAMNKQGQILLELRQGRLYCEWLNLPLQPLVKAQAEPNGSKAVTRIAKKNQAVDCPLNADGDPMIQRALKMGTRALAHDIAVLLNGETGSGKEVMARALHHRSDRSDKPFVAVNCAALPETLIESELFGYREGAFTGSRKGGMQGRFQQADGGVLFLDEIGDMPLALQARLLRVLQERKVAPLGSAQEVDVDIRLICATHCDLREKVAQGNFREDLFYRLNGVTLRLPALRERIDLQNFVLQFLDSINPYLYPIGIDSALLEQFMTYRWPGNVRELKTTLKAALAFMDEDESTINHSHLSDDLLVQLQEIADNVNDCADKVLDNAHFQIQQAISNHNGNMTQAAKQLGISRATLYRKLKVADG